MQGGYSSINLSSSRYACSILSLTCEFYGNVRFCPPFALSLANPVGWKIFAAEGLWHSFARGAWKAGLEGSVGSLQLKWVDTDFLLECWCDIFLNSGQWWSITFCSPSVGPLEKCLGSMGFTTGFCCRSFLPKDVPHSSGFDLSLKLQGWCGHFGILDGAVVQVGCSSKKMRNW